MILVFDRRLSKISLREEQHCSIQSIARSWSFNQVLYSAMLRQHAETWGYSCAATRDADIVFVRYLRKQSHVTDATTMSGQCGSMAQRPASIQRV